MSSGAASSESSRQAGRPLADLGVPPPVEMDAVWAALLAARGMPTPDASGGGIPVPSVPRPNLAIQGVVDRRAAAPGAQVSVPEALVGEAALAEPPGTPGVEFNRRQAEDARNLGRNSALMASGTLVSRVLGMVNATMQVWVLGYHGAANAFSSANTLPNMVYVLIGTGILNAILLPQITKVMRRSDGGREFVDRLLTAAFTLVIGMAIVCTAAAPLLLRVSTRLTGPALHLAIVFGFLCLPQIAFYGIFAILGNVLNSRGSFGAFGWAPVANNVVAIAGQVVFLVLWGRQDDPAAWSPAMVWTLAGSATLGIIVQCLVLVPALRRTGFHWRPRWGLRGQGFGAIGRFSMWTFAALCVAQGGGLVVMSVTTGLAPPTAPGASASAQPFVPEYVAYQKALVLFQVVPSLIAVSILTALFPQLARAWQANSLRGTREIVRQGLVLPAVGMIPASVAMVALAGPLVSTIYFTLSPDQSRGTELILAVMALSTLFYGIAGWQQQYCFASEQGRVNLGMQLLLTLIQVAFALTALVVPAHLGVLTVAVGQVVGNLVVSVVFLAFAQHQLGELRLGGVVWLYARLGLGSLVPGGVAWGVARLITGWNSLWLGQFLGCLAGAAAFGVVFLMMARVLQISEFFDLLQPLLRRLHPAQRLQPAR